MQPTSAPLTRQLDIEALQRAVRWPRPAQRTVLVLAIQLLSARRHRDGYAYFAERSREAPDDALFLTLAGVFQARLGEDLDGALRTLDAATERDLGLPHYFRGVTLAALPDCAGRAETVVADLEFVLAVKDRFPPGLLRPLHRALATAYRTLGRDDDAEEAAARAGNPDLAALVTDYWVNGRDGFHFRPPRLIEPAPGVHVAQGFDFSDIAFVVTDTGVVVIDTGGTERNARRALERFRAVTDLPISHVILTHAHWDHVGGLNVFAGPGTEVVAQAGFPAELRLQSAAPGPFPYFLAAGEGHRHEIAPDRLVRERETLIAGGTEFVLYPIRGGETEDGLVIHLPDRDLAFVGDMIMPQLGAPFFPEGSAPGLFAAMELVLGLGPTLLIHGHAGLTEAFTIATFPGLLAALRELDEVVRADIADGRALVRVLHRDHLPDLLREHPDAVLPYLVVRDNFVQRVYHQNTGYWTPGGEEIERFAPEEMAAALDLLAGGSADAWTSAGRDLLGRGDAALALRLIDYALIVHPGDAALGDLRGQALHRLVERYQTLSPFKFVHYAGRAGLDLPPMG